MSGTLHLRSSWLARAVRAGIADPGEVASKIVDTVAERREHTHGLWSYPVAADWEEQMHRLVAAPWPCPEIHEFWALWSDVLGDLMDRGLRIGRGAFGGWGDGEPAITRAAWCLTLHLRPRRVVETGVARGITSRFILEALARNGSGRLWSIDLPPALKTNIHAQIGAAVPDKLRERWSYVRGSSRRRLRPLLAELSEIDLFIHDSRHSERNLRFELDNAWAALRPGGAVLADDIDMNRGFHSFAQAFPGHRALVCRSEPLEPDPGRQGQTGIFGFAMKTAGEPVTVAVS